MLFDNAWLNLLKKIRTQGCMTRPRALLCQEICGEKFVAEMSWPVLSIESRKLGYRFLCAEAAWILSGDNRVETIQPFSKTIASYSDDGLFFYGAYGPRIIDQLPYVTRKLREDRDTRQAVLSIWRPSPPATKDVPCTLTVQFMVRSNRLNLFVGMRSSDAWLGLPYDFFNFSCLAAYVLLLLGDWTIELGELHMYLSSSHLYEQNFNDADRCLKLGNTAFQVELSPAKQFKTAFDLPQHLWALARLSFGEVRSAFFVDEMRRLYA